MTTDQRTSADPSATATALPLRAGTWRVDPQHSSIGFAIRHLGVSKVRGRFERFDATLHVGDSLESSYVEATVELASVDTANPTRDTHVRSAELLDVERRPTMAFRSTEIIDARTTPSESTWVMRGDLTIGDVTGPLDLAVELGGVEEFVDGTRHAGFEATGQLRRHDFGLDFAGLQLVGKMLGEVVQIVLDVQFVEPRVAG